MNQVTIMCEIQKAIKKKGITQGQLANKLGVSQEIVSRWFNHKVDPSIERLFELAKFSGLEITLYNREKKELITGLPIIDIDQEQKDETIEALTLLLNHLRR